MCDEFGFSAKHEVLTQKLMVELNSDYDFNKTILKRYCVMIIQRRLKLFASSRILVAPPYPYCILRCKNSASSFRNMIEQESPKPESMSTEMYDAVLDHIAADL
jgi:hypothetical protein